MIMPAPQLSPHPFWGGAGGGACRLRPTGRLLDRAFNPGTFWQALERRARPHPNPSPEGEGLYDGEAQKLLGTYSFTRNTV